MAENLDERATRDGGGRLAVLSSRAVDGPPRRDGDQHRAAERAARSCISRLANRQWVVTAYALAFGSLLLLGGRLSDLWGRRTALYVGLAGFAVASAIGGRSEQFHHAGRGPRRPGGLRRAARARRARGAVGHLPRTQGAGEGLRHLRHHRRLGRGDRSLARRGADPVGLVALVPLHQSLLRRRGARRVSPFSFAGGRSEHRQRLDVSGTVLASAGLFLSSTASVTLARRAGEVPARGVRF